MYTGTEIWNKSVGTVPNIHTEDRIRQSTTGEYHIQSNELHPHLSLQPAFQLTARSDLKVFWPWRHARASTAAHASLSGFNLVFDRVVFRTSTGICEKRTLSFPVMEPEVFDTCKSSNLPTTTAIITFSLRHYLVQGKSVGRHWFDAQPATGR